MKMYFLHKMLFPILVSIVIGCSHEWDNPLDQQVDKKENIPTTGLMAWYPFSGNANDESGNGNHGTLYGPCFLTADRFGVANKAYKFEGSCYIKASASRLPVSERTVSIWFNPVALNTIHILLGYGGNSSWGGPGTSWFMGVDGSHFQVSTHYSSKEIKYYFTQKPINTWHHFAATTSAGGSKIYIDGELKAQNNVYINNTYVDGRDMALGVDVSAGGKAPYTDSNVGYFKGSLDNIRIYNRSLTLTEIQALFQEGNWPK